MVSSRILLLATALVFTLDVPAAIVRAEDSATVPTDPGFNPDTGQINTGTEEQAPTYSGEVSEIPTPEETRAALLEPISSQPSAGDMTASASSNSSNNASNNAVAANGGPPPSGPIGAVGQTIPAKFSKRNDILDRTPIMAYPLMISDEERRQIYQAVMADKTAPAAGAEALAPTSELSTQQALEGMHPLPKGVPDGAYVQRFKYVKAKDKVLLVEPSTRIVVDQIQS